jgi:hypothetical protein
MTQESINLEQTENNALTAIANAERDRLFTRNDFSTVNQYSSTHPDAMATGDEYGKGTGQVLDTFNQSAGSSIDIAERNYQLRVNPFNYNRTYPDF